MNERTVRGTVNLKSLLAEQLSFATACALGATRGEATATNDGDRHTVEFSATLPGSQYKMEWVVRFDDDACNIDMYLGNWNSDNVDPLGYAYIRKVQSRFDIDWEYEAAIGTTGAIFTPEKAAAYGELVAKTAAIVSNILEAINSATMPYHNGSYHVGASSLFVEEVR